MVVEDKEASVKNSEVPESESEPVPEEPSPKSDVPEASNVAAAASTDTNPNKIPSHVPYLLIGAGTASFAAYRAIKARCSHKDSSLNLCTKFSKFLQRPPC